MKEIVVKDVIEIMSKSDKFFWNNNIIFLEVGEKITKINNVSKERFAEITEKYITLSKEQVRIDDKHDQRGIRKEPWTENDINLLNKYKHDIKLLMTLLPNRTRVSISAKMARLEEEKNKSPQ
ncbi:MAG: hypothetical protein ACRC8F_09025 [Cetobacterium sp.]